MAKDFNNEKDISARTMRIDIAPTGEAVPIDDEQRSVPEGKDTSFIGRRIPDSGRSAEYEELLQSVYDGVLITDQAGRILEFNERAQDHFLLTEKELSGMSIIGLISGADDSLLNAVHQNLREHRFTLIEASCIRSDHSMFWSEIAVNRVHLGVDGELCFFVRDVSLRRRAQVALEDAVARLEAHDRARSQFVSNVSHELRTPLTSMIYAVSNMQRGVVGPVNKKVRGYLEMLDGDCRRLLSTVDDILDMSRIENRGLKLDRRKVPFARLVRRTVDSMRMQAERSDLTLEMPPDDHVWFVDCDAAKMGRAVLNVLGNAVKFTPAEGRIDIMVGDDPDVAGNVLCTVRDSGVGIPPEAIGKVTMRYYTVGEQPSGSGLGLAIAKELLEVHGGSLRLVSPPEEGAHGTEVKLSLPIVEAPVLLWLGVGSDMLRLADEVERQGYSVLKNEPVSSGIDLIERHEPDVLALDLGAHGTEGTELIVKLKGDKARRDLPIVAVSGGAIDEAKRRIIGSFAIPVLKKSCQPRRLADTITNVFLGPDSISNRPSFRNM